MSDNNNLLSKKKQSMLAELESIKSLLDDELDNIPVLQETVVEEDGVMTVAPLQSLIDLAELSDNIQKESEQNAFISNSALGIEGIENTDTENTSIDIDTLHTTEHSASTTDNRVLPGQQALFKEQPTTKDFHERKKSLHKKNRILKKPHPEKSPTPSVDSNHEYKPVENTVASHDDEAQASAANKATPNRPSPTNNPFLPEHIRHRLNGANGFIPEDPFIATLQQPEQNTNHLDNSDHYIWPSHTPDDGDQHSANQSVEQIIDTIISQYMPKIEADLRKKLYASLQKHNK